MIICEECGARNRNGAYVCEECGASLLHLEATEDDFEPVKRKAPLFGRKQRPTADEPEYEDEEYAEDEAEEYEEQEPEEEPVRQRRPLFGRKPRPVADEPEYEDEEYAEDEAEEYEEQEPEEEPVRQRRPLFGRRPRAVAEEPEYEDEEYPEDDAPEFEEDEPEDEPVRVRRPLFGRRPRAVANEPMYSDDEYAQDNAPEYDGNEPEETIEFRFEGELTEADRSPKAEPEPEFIEESTGTEQEADIMMPEADEPITVEPPVAAEPFAAEQEPETTEATAAANGGSDEAALSFEFEEPAAEETAHIAYKEPIRITKPIRVKSAEPEPEEVPASITIDMEVQEFGDEEDDDEDDSYEEEDSYPAAPVYKADYKAAYQKSVRAENERMTRGMIASIITVSSLLVVTLVVLGVLLIGKNNRAVPVIATTAPTEAATETPTEAPTPSPAAELTPSPTPVPTTPPEEDFGSVFDQPTDGLLPDANN